MQRRFKRRVLVRPELCPALRRELAGTALVFAAIFIAGSLLSSGANADAHCWAAAARFGPLGSCLRASAFTLVGPFAAIFLPLVPILFAAHVVNRLRRDQTEAAFMLLAGTAGYLATAVGLAAGVANGFSFVRGSAGVFGATLAIVFSRILGALGAWLAITLALYAVCRIAMHHAGLRIPVPAIRRKRRVTPMSASTRPTESSIQTPVDSFVSHESYVAVESAPEPEEVLPSSDLLLPPLTLSADAATDAEAMEFRLIGALRNMQLDATVTGRSRGPAVTRYEIEVSPKTPIRDHIATGRDLSVALRCPNIRVASIAGRVAVGIEVPNAVPATVSLRELIDSPAYRDASATLPLSLGRDLRGTPVVADLTKMPHFLIAGGAESGKTVCLNAAITSLVYRHSPRTLRMLVIDTDDAGLSAYDHLPHLWGHVVTDYRVAASVLANALEELRARYELLAASGARNVQEFNQRVVDRSYDASLCAPFMPLDDRHYDGSVLPHLVVVIDDLSDLLRAAPEVERDLTQLAGRARAVGIHILAVTQRSVTEAFSPALLANFPARAALRVTDAADSRAVIERSGAESLLGNGDMLFLPPGRSEAIRLQAPLVSSADTQRLVAWFAAQAGIELPAVVEEAAPVAVPEPQAEPQREEVSAVASNGGRSAA